MRETKGPRGCDLAAECSVIQVIRKLLDANHWVREIYQAVDLIVVAGLHANASVPLFERDSLAYQQRPPRQWLTDDTGLLNHLRKHFRRAVKNRDLEVIDVNVDVVHAEAAQRRQQMLNC